MATAQISKERYERALEQAKMDHCTVTGSGALDYGDGRAPVVAYYVNGVHGDYTVTRGEYALTCNCQAGVNGQYCKHRALVHAWLVAQAEFFKTNN